MPVYIALLRGINVSGQKKVKMAELRDLLHDSGFNDVHTYIQSGNLVIKDKSRNAATIRKRIKDAIFSHFGFDVEVWVKNREDFIRITGQNPFQLRTHPTESQLYYVFLNSVPLAEMIEKLESTEFVNEEFKITDECIYLNCLKGYGKAKCNNNFFENKLKVVATTRNLKTVRKLIELSTKD